MYIDPPFDSRQDYKVRITVGEDDAAADQTLRPGREPTKYDIVWSERPSQVFLTRNNALIASLSSAVENVTGNTADLTRWATGRGANGVVVTGDGDVSTPPRWL